ncbi:MAG TPA: TonB family protein [Gammaproteobacteria bacterium]|nr:TonB family protein [Gammaproteobacteria bacterium]
MKKIELLGWMLPIVLSLSIGVSARAGITSESVHEHDDFSRVLALAEKGNVEAELCVAKMYFTGWGTSRDFNQAFAWNSKAAASGSLAGKSEVGKAYMWGAGVFKDTKRAQDIFLSLINQGYMPAASSLGEMYMHGYGVSTDLKKAFDWYEKAAISGDPEAEWNVGMMYKNGFGINANMSLARQWLDKLPAHKPECMPDFRVMINQIIFGNVTVPKYKTKGEPSGKMITASFLYHNGEAVSPRIVQTSGYPALDAALLKAIRDSHFPPWPTDYENLDKTVTFVIQRAGNTAQHSNEFNFFTESLKSAIREAMVLPKHVLVYGSKGTGIATVSFEYLDGKVHDVYITKSSGDKYEDAEAIRSVENAKYPPTPDLYKGQSMSFEIPINFGVYSPTSSLATKTSPATASTH